MFLALRFILFPCPLIFIDGRGFGVLGHRADHRVAPVVAAQPRRHGGRGAREELVEQEGVDQIVAVVAQGDLGAAHVDGRRVEDAPAQPVSTGCTGSAPASACRARCCRCPLSAGGAGSRCL